MGYLKSSVRERRAMCHGSALEVTRGADTSFQSALRANRLTGSEGEALHDQCKSAIATCITVEGSCVALFVMVLKERTPMRIANA